MRLMVRTENGILSFEHVTMDVRHVISAPNSFLCEVVFSDQRGNVIVRSKTFSRDKKKEVLDYLEKEINANYKCVCIISMNELNEFIDKTEK